MTEFNKLISNKYLWSLVLATLLGYCLIMEYSKPTLHNHNHNQNVRYYDSVKPTSKVVISDKLQDPNTLEQEMVNTMKATTSTYQPQLTPRYRPLLPNSAGASLVD